MRKSGIIFVLLAALVLQPEAVFAQNPTAVIREMTGTVELKMPGSSVWVAARAGDVIEEAAIISTGFRSTALLSVGNSTLTVQALTRLSLRELINQDNTETINISLSAGRVRVEVAAPAGSAANFTVQTPAATASVRGTIFEIDVDSIRVIEGVVVFASAARPDTRAVLVSAGQGSMVDAGTGRAAIPMAAAEAASALPRLPGQAAGLSEGGARIEPVAGTLVVEVELQK